ncbi:MAG TPA: ABC transporter substrate-binding protein, partial [Candidatus Eisenbacteria bacterium]|nr:ABC transporter substrate-binding protein [Candidatus Eisenbacteria bacterium]
RHYTFPALVTTEDRITRAPESARAAIRAVMRAQTLLREDPGRSLEVAKKRFPASEAELITELIRRDAPYYDPTITPDTVASMNRFAHESGLLSNPVPYEKVVAARLSYLWHEPI